MRHEVQTFTLCDGWINCWSDEAEQPITYATEQDARAALDEYLADQAEAVRCGEMLETYARSDFRVVPIRKEATA